MAASPGIHTEHGIAHDAMYACVDSESAFLRITPPVEFDNAELKDVEADYTTLEIQRMAMSVGGTLLCVQVESSEANLQTEVMPRVVKRLLTLADAATTEDGFKAFIARQA
ncbi:MAG TPA: hypothetical protein VIM53_01885 [Candidatus Saccharimonadales bacterium]